MRGFLLGVFFYWLGFACVLGGAGVLNKLKNQACH